MDKYCVVRDKPNTMLKIRSELETDGLPMVVGVEPRLTLDGWMPGPWRVFLRSEVVDVTSDFAEFVGHCHQIDASIVSVDTSVDGVEAMVAEWKRRFDTGEKFTVWITYYGAERRFQAEIKWVPQYGDSKFRQTGDVASMNEMIGVVMTTVLDGFEL